MQKWLPLVVAAVFILLIVYVVGGSSASATGLPEGDGVYPVQAGSVSYDGSAYRFVWFDEQNAGHTARSSQVQLQKDEKSFLEMKSAQPVLHLSPEEPVTVHGRDDRGSFTSTWFPFLVGYALGGGFNTGPPVVLDQGGPAYRYPPADSINRDATAYGSTASTKRETQDFTKAKPAINAIGGKNSGTGSGTAATNKSATSSVQGGQAGGAGTGAAATSKSSSAGVSGQAGGTGTGSAATSKSAPKIGGKAPTGFSGGGKPSIGFSGGKRR